MNFPARTVTMSLRRRIGNRLLKPTHIILPLLVAFVLPYVAARRASLSPVRLANLLARARSSGLTCKAFTNSAWPRRKVGKSIRTLPKLRGAGTIICTKLRQEYFKHEVRECSSSPDESCAGVRRVLPFGTLSL